MKTLLLLLLIPSMSLADTMVVPKKCLDVIDTKVSTGGDKSTAYYISVTCKTETGNVIYTVTQLSLTGFLGVGRFALPDTIEVIKEDVQKPVLR